MRIAFVTPEYITERNFDGGLANHLARVCPALATLGHEVSVVVTSDRSERLMKDGVEVHRVPVNPALELCANRLTLWRLPATVHWLLQGWALNRALARLHRQAPFQVVQYASYAATGLFRLKAVPAVVRISSYQVLLQEASDAARTLDHRLVARLDAAAIRKADATFGPSRLIADVVVRELGRPVQVIEPPFSLEPSGWDERPYRELLAGKRYLLFFGTLSKLKGVASIAEIIARLLERDPGLHFVFIGKDTGFLGRPMIEHVWNKAGSLRGRVLYLGQMRHQQLHPVLAGAHAVVLPSLIDNLPNTCLEAMALGRVVVGTRGASFEQLIEDGVNGFLCDRYAPESLLAAVERALGLTEEARCRMGERAAERIAQLKPEVALEKLVEFLRAAAPDVAGRA